MSSRQKSDYKQIVEETTSNSKCIAKNTVFLYVRMLLLMFVSFFTSRVVLQTLGVDDYGIYNVVGGFVAMFSILSSSLVNASQRFISYEMGKVNPQMSRAIFKDRPKASFAKRL